MGKFYKHTIFSLGLMVLLTTASAIAQETTFDKRKLRKGKYLNDFNHYGVGAEFFQPQFLNMPAPPTSVGLNINLLFLEAGFMQSYWNIDRQFVLENPTGTLANQPYNMFVRQNYFGVNVPLPFLNFGGIKQKKFSVRAHPVGLLRFGQTHLTPTPELQAGAQSKAYTAALGIGYRLRTPYLTAEIRYAYTVQFFREGNFEYGLNPNFGQTSIVLRFYGMFERSNRRNVWVDATKMSVSIGPSQSTSYNRYNANGTVTRITNTTTPVSVSASPTKTVLSDIGVYRGMGIRYQRSRPSTDYYTNTAGLLGLNALFRKGVIISGLNIETGRVGHASVMDEWDDAYSKTVINKAERYAQGSLNTFNTTLDLGLDLTSAIHALVLGLVYDSGENTPFASFNAGYSLGFHTTWNQRFDNPDEALAKIDALPGERTKWDDARESGSSYLGIWWMGLEMGNVGVRASWYRYRGAPLANNLMIGVSYRLRARGRR